MSINKHESEIDEYLKQVFSIYQDAAMCFEYANYLQHPATDVHSNIINYFSALKTLKNTCARISIIELSKLLAKNPESNKYNFHTFLTRLIEGHLGREYKNDSRLLTWKVRLQDAEKIIIKVIGLRDSIYAHLDKPKKIAQLENVENEEVRTLIDLAKDFIMFLWNDYFHDRALLYNSDSQEIENLLNHIKLPKKVYLFSDQMKSFAPPNENKKNQVHNRGVLLYCFLLLALAFHLKTSTTSTLSRLGSGRTLKSPAFARPIY